MEKKKPRSTQKNFDQKIFEGLCHINCTMTEIRSVLQAHEATINKWCLRTYEKSFKEIYEEYKEMGKASLRRNQMEMSKKNATMAIWLGKQLLGQREIPIEYEQFNGKLSLLLDTLKTIKNESELRANKMEKLEEVIQEESKIVPMEDSAADEV